VTWSKDDTTVLILLVGEASGVFAGFCPSWFTVSSPFFHEQDAKAGNIKRIRWGEASATAIVVGTGWAVSSRSANNTALWVSFAICAVFIAGYEYMIAHPSTEDEGRAQVAEPVQWWERGSYGRHT
jgi:hypothetical protein